MTKSGRLKVLLVRHGESENNADARKKLNGYECDLTERGHEQAESVAGEQAIAPVLAACVCL